MNGRFSLRMQLQISWKDTYLKTHVTRSFGTLLTPLSINEGKMVPPLTLHLLQLPKRFQYPGHSLSWLGTLWVELLGIRRLKVSLSTQLPSYRRSDLNSVKRKSGNYFGKQTKSRSTSKKEKRRTVNGESFFSCCRVNKSTRNSKTRSLS